MSKIISFRITEKQNEKMSNVATQMGVSKNKAIQKIIDEYHFNDMHNELNKRELVKHIIDLTTYASDLNDDLKVYILREIEAIQCLI